MIVDQIQPGDKQSVEIEYVIKIAFFLDAKSVKPQTFESQAI